MSMLKSRRVNTQLPTLIPCGDIPPDVDLKMHVHHIAHSFALGQCLYQHFDDIINICTTVTFKLANYVFMFSIQF